MLSHTGVINFEKWSSFFGQLCILILLLISLDFRESVTSTTLYDRIHWPTDTVCDEHVRPRPVSGQQVRFPASSHKLPLSQASDMANATRRSRPSLHTA